MTEPQNANPSPPPPPTPAGVQMARLFMGLILVLIPLVIIAGVCYLCWPLLKPQFMRFYN